jgi:hypothetical protein
MCSCIRPAATTHRVTVFDTRVSAVKGVALLRVMPGLKRSSELTGGNHMKRASVRPIISPGNHTANTYATRYKALAVV